MKASLFLFISSALVAMAPSAVGQSDAKTLTDAQRYNAWYANLIHGTLLQALEVECDWTLPDAGIVKKSLDVLCPSGCLDHNSWPTVKGSGVHPVNSPVCLSAIHDGVIPADKGGPVRVSVRAGLKSYEGKTQNGVSAAAYGPYFNSFVVQKSDITCGPTLPPTEAPCIHTAVVDMVFVADSSLSVGADDFKTEMKFISDIVGLFTVGPEKARVGMTTFNTFAHTIFKLEKYKTQAEVQAAIAATKFETGGTYVGKALWQVFRDMKFRTDSKVKKIAVVFTDGRSADSVDRPVDKLSDEGVEVIAFGVGKVEESSLLAIAHGNKENVYSVQSYDVLKNYMGSLMTRICAFVLAGK